MDFLVNSTKYLRKINSKLSQTRPKIEEVEKIPNTFYKPIITLLMPDKDTTRKKKIKGQYI